MRDMTSYPMSHTEQTNIVALLCGLSKVLVIDVRHDTVLHRLHEIEARLHLLSKLHSKCFVTHPAHLLLRWHRAKELVLLHVSRGDIVATLCWDPTERGDDVEKVMELVLVVLRHHLDLGHDINIISDNSPREPQFVAILEYLYKRTCRKSKDAPA